jgi:choline dehydrogenase-like flavoprotein
MPTKDLDADVIVIGSGVLGSLAAMELAKAGKSVIILEAGPRVSRRQVVENFRNVVDKVDQSAPYPDAPHAPNPFGGKYLQQKGPVAFGATYLRVVGGTTWHWSSATWRLLPNDFKLRTLYGRGRDWPIGYSDLEPFYARAERELGVNGNANEDQSGQGGAAFPPRSTPYPMPGLPFAKMELQVSQTLGQAGFHPIHEPNGRASEPYEGRPACCGNNNCVPICPIGAQYSGDVHATKAERAGARLIENAVVHQIDVGADRQVSGVRYLSPDRTEHRLTARHYVLAAHGIEAPKLLQMSVSETTPHGVANSSDMVGRNLMDHTGISMIILAKEPLWPGRGPMELLVFLNSRDGGFRRDHSAYKHKLRSEVPNRVITQTLLSQGVLGSKLDAQIAFRSARWLNFATDFETLPNPQNRITPSADIKDALGLPVPEIHYDVDDYWTAGRDAALQDLHRFATVLDGEVVSIDLGHQNRQHIMGTMIMGADPKDSVVDGDCRSHDHPNLFIVSTGVMPASACVNPTLTGAALSIRMAATIAAEV